MGFPEHAVNRFRTFCVFPLIVLIIAGGLSGCRGGCDADSEIGCEDSDIGQTIDSQNPVENPGDVSVPLCSTSGSDSDGDGYGFENGASCRFVVDSGVINGAATIDDINHIIVVTGQSNVEAPETAFDPILDKPHPRVFAFTDEGWQIADLHQVWDENAHPGNHSLTDPSNSPNNNFVFHFGKSLAQLDETAVPAFIVLAAPGKGIATWDYESLF